MNATGELLLALFVFCLGFIILTEFFFHIIQNKIREKRHSHPPACDRVGNTGSVSYAEVDKEEKGQSRVFPPYDMDGASHPAFLLKYLKRTCHHEL